MIRNVYRRLGGDILQIELTNKDVYACLEQAMLEYSSIVNTYQAKSTLINMIGIPTGSMSGSQNQVPRYDLNYAKRASEGFSSEAMVGGTKPLFSASISLVSGQQHYDLNVLLSSSGLVTTRKSRD